MKIDYKYYLKRKRTDIESFIKDNKIRCYDDLKKHFMTINVTFPDEDSVNKYFQNKKKATPVKTAKKPAQKKRTVSKSTPTRRKKRTRKENAVNGTNSN